MNNVPNRCQENNFNDPSESDHNDATKDVNNKCKEIFKVIRMKGVFVGSFN